MKTKTACFTAIAAALFLLSSGSLCRGAVQGLPFTEDFSDTSLRDSTLTDANWSTDEQAVYLAWKKRIYGVSSWPAVLDIGTLKQETRAVSYTHLRAHET